MSGGKGVSIPLKKSNGGLNLRLTVNMLICTQIFVFLFAVIGAT